MSAPQSPPGGDGEGGGGGEAAMRPDEARAFAGKVDALEQGVAEAQAALERVAARNEMWDTDPKWNDDEDKD